MESYGTIENNKEEVSTSTPSKSRRLVSIVGVALALVGVTLLVKVNTPTNSKSTNSITDLKIVKPVTVESTETTTDEVRGSLRGVDFTETFQPTPVMYPTAVRSLAPTKAPHEESKKEKKDTKSKTVKRKLKEDDVETSKTLTLNPTPKAGVKTLAPTPENLKKRAMKSIDSINYVETFQPTPESGVRTLAPTPENLSKRMLKEDVETSSKTLTLNPTPKAGVKTLAPTPENLSKRLMKESIDTTDFTESFNPTPVMFPSAVRSLAPHEEREVKKSSSRRSLRAAFDKSNVDEIPKGETRNPTPINLHPTKKPSYDDEEKRMLKKSANFEAKFQKSNDVDEIPKGETRQPTPINLHPTKKPSKSDDRRKRMLKKDKVDEYPDQWWTFNPTPVDKHPTKKPTKESVKMIKISQKI